MARTRIGFVGVGCMGQCAHLRSYATLPDCEVVAIAELRPKLGQRVAARYAVHRLYRNHEEMLANEKLDGIVASQPYDRHGSLVPELLNAGVPILTEKPLAASIEMGERIVEHVGKSGTWHMVGYHKRSDPATMYAKAEIDRLKSTKELGEMRYVRVVMPPGDWVAGGFSHWIETDEPWPDVPPDPPASDLDRAAFEEYSGFVNYYIHQVNLVRHLLGEPYRVSYADPSGVVLVGHSDSGVACTIEMSPYATTVDWQESALVGFERGYVKLELPAPVASNRPGRVEVLRDPGEAVPVVEGPHLPWIDAMRQQAVNFLAAIRGEMEPMCQAEEALEDLRIARQYLKLLRGV